MRILHINTICREEAKKLAPWANWTVRVEGGFIAYEDKKDVPYAPKKPRKKRECFVGNRLTVSEDDKNRYMARMKHDEDIIAETAKKANELAKKEMLARRLAKVEEKRKITKNKYYPFKSKKAFMMLGKN